MNCRKDKNMKNCPCDSMDCPRRGICCECVAHHKKDGSLPACLR